MKTITLLLFAAAVLQSCEKSYHCSCEVVSTQGDKYTSVTSSFKDDADSAAKACENQEQSTALTGQFASCQVVPE